jgi:hypothetical protein
MEGNPGRYISIEKGPKAESNPKINITRPLFLMVMLIEFGTKIVLKHSTMQDSIEIQLIMLISYKVFKNAQKASLLG